MNVNIVDRLRFRDGKSGCVKVSDGGIIILRVAVVNVGVREEASRCYSGSSSRSRV